MRFARIIETLGMALIRCAMTLITLPAIIAFLLGTVILTLVSIKLQGLEFNNQKVQAAYRKELILNENDAEYTSPQTRKGILQMFAQIISACIRANYTLIL